MPKKKNPGGRPTKMTEDTLKKLEEAFKYGCPDVEACYHAGISRQTLYNYQEKYPEFIDQKERWKNNPNFLARRNAVLALEEVDTDMSKWWLGNKLNNEFNTRQKNDIGVDSEQEEFISSLFGKVMGVDESEQQD